MGIVHSHGRRRMAVLACALAAIAPAAPARAQSKKAARAAAMVDAAEKALAAKDWRGARTLFRKARRTLPKGPEAEPLATRVAFGLGSVLLAGKKHREAVKEFGPVAKAEGQRALDRPVYGKTRREQQDGLRELWRAVEGDAPPADAASRIETLRSSLSKDYTARQWAPAMDYLSGRLRERAKDWLTAATFYASAAKAGATRLRDLAHRRAAYDAKRVRTPAKIPKTEAPPGKLAGPYAAAVEQGLAWLAKFQCPDGSWDERKLAELNDGTPLPANRAKFTPNSFGGALALMAFVRGGVTGDHATLGPALKKALAWVSGAQDASGRLTQPYESRVWVTPQAQWTWALAVAVSGLPDGEQYKPFLDRAVACLLDARNPDLGWRYTAKPGDNDSDNTAAALLALLRARLAGATVPDEAIDGGLRWLDIVTDQVSGRTGYTQPGDKGGMHPTAMGFQWVELNTAQSLACRTLAGRDRSDPLFARGYDLLWARAPAWVPGKDLNLRYALYYSYAYGLQESAAANYNLKRVADLLVKHQEASGPGAGSWPAIGVQSYEGRIAATARAILTICNARGVALPAVPPGGKK